MEIRYAKAKTNAVADILSRECAGAVNTNSLADWNKAVVTKLQNQEDTRKMKILEEYSEFAEIMTLCWKEIWIEKSQ